MKLEIEPIPGFDALKFKDEMQARVQAELDGLTPEEQVRRIRENVENGPFADLWKRIQRNDHRDETAPPPEEPARST